MTIHISNLINQEEDTYLPTYPFKSPCFVNEIAYAAPPPLSGLFVVGFFRLSSLCVFSNEARG